MLFYPRSDIHDIRGSGRDRLEEPQVEPICSDVPTPAANATDEATYTTSGPHRCAQIVVSAPAKRIDDYLVTLELDMTAGKERSHKDVET